MSQTSSIVKTKPKKSVGSTGKPLAKNAGGLYWTCPYCGSCNRHNADQHGVVSGDRRCDRCGAEYDLT